MKSARRRYGPSSQALEKTRSGIAKSGRYPANAPAVQNETTLATPAGMITSGSNAGDE